MIEQINDYELVYTSTEMERYRLIEKKLNEIITQINANTKRLDDLILQLINERKS